MDNPVISVLLVDDDDVDVRVVKKEFARHQLTNPIVVARNGVEALEILRGTAEKPALEKPFLILLDLNMPRMSGLEFLEELRADPDLHHTIVFVLTTSNDQADRMAAYSKHAAGYLLKHDAGRVFSHHIPMFENFLASVQFPITRSTSTVPWELQPVEQF
ncbi:response regulator [Pirellulales bacterium]|nr:response regulator [Pirellulales bacterium]